MKKFLLFSLMFILLVFSVSAYEACSDTDGGSNIYVRGTMSYITDTDGADKIDYCENEMLLIEYNCADIYHPDRVRTGWSHICEDGKIIQRADTSTGAWISAFFTWIWDGILGIFRGATSDGIIQSFGVADDVIKAGVRSLFGWIPGVKDNPELITTPLYILGIIAIFIFLYAYIRRFVKMIPYIGQFFP
jgi:hypothetical protein